MPFNRLLVVTLSAWTVLWIGLAATSAAQSVDAQAAFPSETELFQAQTESFPAQTDSFPAQTESLPSETESDAQDQSAVLPPAQVESPAPLESPASPLSPPTGTELPDGAVILDDGTVVYPGLEPMPGEGWGFDPTNVYYIPPFEPWIFVSGRLMWLHRTGAATDQALVDATTATTAGAVLTTENLRFPVEAGVRGTLMFAVNNGQFIELGYLGIFDQQAQASVTLDPATTGVVDMTQYFFGTAATSVTTFDATAVYESSLHSPELNWWLRDNDWQFRPMIGIRWIQQAEDFQLFETSAPGNGGVAEMTNDLVGAQLGFQAVVWQRADWFRVQAIGKAGVYHNQLDLNAELLNGGVPLATLSRNFTTTSFGAEIILTAVWQLTPHLSFHVGYTGLWMTDTGLVVNQSRQFDVLTGTGELEHGTLRYQGGHLGCTIAW